MRGLAELTMLLERHDAAERQPTTEVEGAPGFVRAAVKQWNTVRSGTPSASRTRKVSSHAPRVDHQRLAEPGREMDLEPERHLLLVARVLVVEIEPGFADADALLGARERLSMSHSAASFDASCGCKPTVARTIG